MPVDLTRMDGVSRMRRLQPNTGMVRSLEPFACDAAPPSFFRFLISHSLSTARPVPCQARTRATRR